MPIISLDEFFNSILSNISKQDLFQGSILVVFLKTLDSYKKGRGHCNAERKTRSRFIESDLYQTYNNKHL